MRVPRIVHIVPLVGIALAVATPSAHAQAVTQTSVTRVPFSFVAGNTVCTEFISFDGFLVQVNHFTAVVDGDGNATQILFKTQSVSGGLTGVELATGERYTGVLVGGAHVTQDAADAFPTESTVTSTFNVVSRGDELNALVHMTNHYTLNANGDLTASQSNVNVECRG
jgi:hypothetical protein